MPKIIIKNPATTGGDRKIRLVKTPTTQVNIKTLVGAMYEDQGEIRICLSPLTGIQSVIGTPPELPT